MKSAEVFRSRALLVDLNFVRLAMLKAEESVVCNDALAWVVRCATGNS